MNTPERELEKARESMDDTARHLEERNEQLAHDIDDAREQLREMERRTGGEVAGDWEGTDDASGGEDPEGATRRD